MAQGKILIVEDEPAIRDQYATILGNHGYQVRVAKDTKDGKKLLDDDAPDILILDVFLPGENGISFLRSNGIPANYPGMKVLVVTNVEPSEFEAEVSKLGVNKVALKADYTPYEMADLVDKL